MGDVHGEIDTYLLLRNQFERTVQVGDMSFQYNFPHSPNHLFISGNHDNHDIVSQHQSFMGRYGNTLGMFFLSGGHSIDKQLRTEYIDWWSNEELSIDEMTKAVKLYKSPRVVVTHECPDFVVDQIGDINILKSYGYDETWRSYTSRMLGMLWKLHQPEYWIFGHHHKSIQLKIGPTTFRCVDMINSGDSFTLEI